MGKRKTKVAAYAELLPLLVMLAKLSEVVEIDQEKKEALESLLEMTFGDSNKKKI